MGAPVIGFVIVFAIGWVILMGGILALSLVARGALYLVVALCYFAIWAIAMVNWVTRRERPAPTRFTELRFNRRQRRWE